MRPPIALASLSLALAAFAPARAEDADFADIAAFLDSRLG